MDKRIRPLVIGHRGNPGVAPDNSLEGFLSAISGGADGVELDVVVDRDGCLMVVHTTTLGGLSGADYVRGDLSLALGRNIPTLAEVIEALPRESEIIVEIKSSHTKNEIGAARAIAQAVSAPERRIIISSFDPWALQAMALVNPAIPLALNISSRESIDHHTLSKRDLSHIDILSLSHDLIPGPFCDLARARALFIAAWPVDEADDVARCLDPRATVSYIITNRPAEVAGIVKTATADASR